MLRLIGLAVSIGLADSLNPTTIAPALYLAAGERSRERVAEFTLGVFVVYLGGGAAIALGPGQLLLSAIPHPDRVARHVIEVAAGVAMLVAAAYLWFWRKRLSQRKPPNVNPEGKSSWILGATITAVELPTAFPYFAVIAAIVGSGIDPARQVLCLVLFNVCFIAPLLVILAVLAFEGERAEELLCAAREKLQRNWPGVLAGLLFLAGTFVVLLGVTGLSPMHSRVGRLLRHFPPFRHP
jgi:cytochrome c biogenesis protein CcdA